MFDFAGKSALVTGGTSGIGKAIALAFAGAGAQVTAAGLPSSEDDGVRGLSTVHLDVTDAAGIRKLAGGIGPLDVLVNAAGVIRRDVEFDPDVFAEVVDINLTGTMRMCSAFHPQLAASKGNVVNVASMLSFFGGARVPAYAASKGGIAQLTKSLALAWAAEGIRVNAVAPGWIATPLTEALQGDAARSAAVLNRTAMGRWGKPEEIAGPVLFLCSDAASFMTGSIVVVDGGYSAA